MRSFAKFLRPMMENKAFRNISSSEFRQGVYAVPLTRISAQGIRDGGPVDERDDKRVVGKGWRLVDGTKIEVLLFEDGTWGNSEEYARVPKKKSQRVSRPPSMTSPQGRNRTTSVAFAAPPFTPYVTGTNSRPAANSDEQVAKADVGTGQLAEAEKTITVCDSLKADLDSLARSSQESTATIRKPIVRSDTAVKSLNLESDASSGYNASNEEESEASATSSLNHTRHSVRPSDQQLRQMNAKVNERPFVDRPKQRGGAARKADWLSKVKQAVSFSKEPFDHALKMYDEADRDSKLGFYTVQNSRNYHLSCGADKGHEWPTPSEAAHRRNLLEQADDTRSATDQSIEQKTQIELWKNLPEATASFSTEVVFRQIQQEESMRLGLGTGGRSDRQIVLNAVRERVFREQQNGTMNTKIANDLIAYSQLRLGKRRSSVSNEESEWDMLEDNDVISTAAKNGVKLSLYDVNYDHRHGRGRYLSQEKSC